jgi:hypothetical protein
MAAGHFIQPVIPASGSALDIRQPGGAKLVKQALGLLDMCLNECAEYDHVPAHVIDGVPGGGRAQDEHRTIYID